MAGPQARPAVEQRDRGRAGNRRWPARASRPRQRADLFWALRGGGGNFGVITAIEFAVYPVEQLYAGVMLFEFERAAEVLHTWNDSLPAMPDELTSWASLLHVPDLPFAPEPLRGRSFVAVLAAFLGDEA